MKCGDTCRHNISKLNSGLSVKLLQLPLQRSGKALEESFEGACSIFLQKSFILVRHIYWIFRLLRGGWLGCTRAFVKWHLSPYPLKFSLWSSGTTQPHCHCTPRHPRARALARLVSSSQGMAGLAWHGKKDVLELCPRSFDVFLQVGFVVENPKPKQQVEQGLNMDRINEINDWFWNPV